MQKLHSEVIDSLGKTNGWLGKVEGWRFWVLAALALILLRAPLCLQNLEGEEGLFAFLSYNSWEQPRTLIGASLAGVNYYINPEHPLPLYYVFRTIGYCVHGLLGDVGPRGLAIGIRAALGLLNLLAIFTLCMVLERKLVPTEVRGSYRLICAVILSMLYSSVTSVHVQIEGAVGVAAFSFALSFLLLADRPGRYWLAVPAGVLVGLGKNEWTLLCATAAILLPVLARLNNSEGKTDWSRTFLLGLAFGNLLAYLADPFDYLAGFDVMGRILAATAGVPFKNKMAYAVFTMRLFVIPVLLLLLLIFWDGPRTAFRRRYNPMVIFSAMCTVGILTAYFKACWVGDGGRFPRYFTISFPFIIVMSGALVGQLKLRSRAGVLTAVAILLLGLNLAAHARFFYKNDLTFSGQAAQGAFAEAQRRIASGAKGCVQYVRPDVAFYLGGLDFANSDLGDWYRQYTNMPLCP